MKTKWFEIPEIKKKEKTFPIANESQNSAQKLFGGFFRKQSHVKYFSKTHTNAIV